MSYVVINITPTITVDMSKTPTPGVGIRDRVWPTPVRIQTVKLMIAKTTKGTGEF